MFRPDVWAEQIKSKPEYEPGELFWLLDHWYWPFTDSALAKWYAKQY